MNNKPKVSIIMPVFKTEPYIEKTIQSVLKQSYPNIELLCVNDDTPDGAFEICRKYQKKYHWIKLAVSYTHLDVYKRQPMSFVKCL